MIRIKIKYICFLLLILSMAPALGQSKKIGEQYEDLTDSLKANTYPYVLPIWGDRVQKKGFDLQLPLGVMINYVRSVQRLQLNNFELSVNNSEFVDIDDVIKFDLVEADVNTLNVRPDLWLFPFLNVYGLLGYVQNETTVRLALPIKLNALAETQGPYYGFGFLVALGFGPVFTQTWL